jgi:predicted PurR-regulated permease PerM
MRSFSIRSADDEADADQGSRMPAHRAASRPRAVEGRGVPVTLALVGTLWARQWARPAVLPLRAAGFFALLTYPVVARRRRLRLSQTMAATVAMLLVVGAFVLLTTIEGQVVQPIAVGHRLAVSALVVMIALLFWGWLWGVPGLILAVVRLVLSIKAVCTHVTAWRPIAAAMSPAPRWTPLPRRRSPRAAASVPPRKSGAKP